MAKTKGHVSLYEILQSEKMAKAEIKSPPLQQIKVEEPTKVVQEQPKVEPQETKAPAVEQTQLQSVAPYEFGEKIVKLTYNSAIFFVIVTLFLLFVAFSYGLKLGKKWVEPKITTSQSAHNYNIIIAQFPYTTAEQQRNAVAQVQNLEEKVAGAKHVLDLSGKWLVVYYGSYADKNSEEAREAISYVVKTLEKYNISTRGVEFRQ